MYSVLTAFWNTIDRVVSRFAYVPLRAKPIANTSGPMYIIIMHVNTRHREEKVSSLLHGDVSSSQPVPRLATLCWLSADATLSCTAVGPICFRQAFERHHGGHPSSCAGRPCYTSEKNIRVRGVHALVVRARVVEYAHLYLFFRGSLSPSWLAVIQLAVMPSRASRVAAPRCVGWINRHVQAVFASLFTTSQVKFIVYREPSRDYFLGTWLFR